MTTLKEKIESKFEFDEDKIWDNCEDTKTWNVFACGAKFQHEQMTQDLLPILLECVEALELNVKQGYGAQGYIEEDDHEGLANYYSDIIRERENQTHKALERLRKWSEKT